MKIGQILDIVKLFPIPGVSTAAGIASIWFDRFEKARYMENVAIDIDDELKTVLATAAIQHLVKRLKSSNVELKDVDESELTQLLEASPEVAAIASKDPQILNDSEQLKSRMGEISRLLNKLDDITDTSPERVRERRAEQLAHQEELLKQLREKDSN